MPVVSFVWRWSPDCTRPFPAWSTLATHGRAAHRRRHPRPRRGGGDRGRRPRDPPASCAEMIVVDNGSRDRTAEAARAAGARVVIEPRRGYGHACLAGIAAAGEADVFVFLDGDHSDYPAQLVDVVGPDPRRPRRPRDRLAPPRPARGGRAAVARGPRHEGVRGPPEPAGGRRGPPTSGRSARSRAEALRRLGMRDRNYGWTVEMQVKAARQGLRVVEVPVDHRPRVGRSKVSGTVRGTIGAGTKIVGDDPAPRVGRPGPSLAACAGLVALGVRRSAGRSAAPPPSRIGAAPRALRRWPSPRTSSALVAARGLSRRGLLLCLAVGRRSGGPCSWPCRRSSATTSTATSGRAASRSTAATRTAGPTGPTRRGGSPLRDAVCDGLNHKDYTAVYPPLFVLATRAVVGRPRLDHRHEGVPRGVRGRHAGRRWPSSCGAAASRSSGSSCSPGARSPSSRSPAADTTRPSACCGSCWRSSPSTPTGRSSRPSPRARASCRSTCPASWPPPGRAGTGGGTCSPARRSSLALVAALPRRRLEEDDAAEPLEVRAVLAFNETLFAPLAAVLGRTRPPSAPAPS